MHPKFHAILYNFFIQGLDLDRIAAIHETSWCEVAKVLDSEPAKELMRSAIRVERLRAIAENLASRRSALRNLGAVADSLDRTPSGMQSRRRAADAILRGTKPGRSSAPSQATARPKTQLSPIPEPSAPEPTKQPQPQPQTPTRSSSSNPSRTPVRSCAPVRTSPLKSARPHAKPAHVSRTSSASTPKTRPAQSLSRAHPVRQKQNSS